MMGDAATWRFAKGRPGRRPVAPAAVPMGCTEAQLPLLILSALHRRGVRPGGARTGGRRLAV